MTNTSPDSNRRLRSLLGGFAIWTGLGLFTAVRLFLIYNTGQYEISWSLSIAWALADWYIWGLLSLIIIAVTRRVSIESSPWYKVAAIHLPLAFVIGLSQLFFYAQASNLLDNWFYHNIGTGDQSVWTTWYYLSLNRWHTVIITYFLITAAAYAWQFYKHKRAEELRRIEAENQLSRAQLSSLKARLHPHFLFNTLNAVTALIHTEPKTADRMISRLSDLLRMAIDSDDQPEISLQRELEFVERYVSIQQLRFPDRLEVTFSIEPEARDAIVPNLILQPLVENAVQYAVAPFDRKGTIEITASQTGDRLLLTVSDSGPGLPAGFSLADSGGIGLKSVHDRLRGLYGANADLRFDGGGDRPFVVTISLPFRINETPEETA